MIPFDPNWPHGHTLDGGGKVEIIKILDNGWVVGMAYDSAGMPWANAWPPDGSPTRDCSHRLINAPAPKRSGFVSIYAMDGQLHPGRVTASLEESRRLHSGPLDQLPIAIVPWTEGDGMEEKDG